ncbi:hypothetical protein [Chryseobacterium sp. 3008163]|nr:hypothetical protein [Chryseobacterium sp. 3008163]
MGHQHRGFFDKLVVVSHAVEQANHLEIPLLIIPEGQTVSF